MPDYSAFGGSLAKSPLSKYSATEVGRDPRGGFQMVSVTPAGTNTYQFEVVEPLMISPCLTGFSKEDDEGFVNINNIQLTVRFKTNTSMLWSHDAQGANKITAVTQRLLDIGLQKSY